MANALVFGFLVKTLLHLVFKPNKIFSINFWVKLHCIYFFYLPVSGWWNGISIIWHIVILWVLQKGFSPSVIAKAVCSKTAPAVLVVSFHLSVPSICVFLRNILYELFKLLWYTVFYPVDICDRDNKLYE